MKITDEMVEAACASHWPWPGDRTDLILAVRRRDMRNALSAALAQEGEAEPVARQPYDLRVSIGTALDRLITDDSTPDQVDLFIATFAEHGLTISFSHPAPADAGVVEGQRAADQIIGQIEERFPNWRSYRDLIDCIECTLHDLRSNR